jgi:glycosyltransferase involved in cell wall biosynthesis
MIGLPNQEVRVLLFTQCPSRYGAEEHMLTLLRELPRPQFRLHMACPPQLAEKIRADVPGDVELFELPLRSSTRVGDAFRMAKILRERKIDVLHSHMSHSSRFASPIGWLCGVPAVLETPHVAENWRHGWLKGSYAPDRIVGHFVDYFIAVSNANARYLIDTKKLPSKKVVVIRNGCDLKRFDSGADDRSAARKKLGLEEGIPIVIVPARLEPQKGHAVLLEAIPAILKKFPRLQVMCLGDGTLRKELETKVRDLNIRETVHFAGFQQNMTEWLCAGDLTVLPSFYEGLPLVAIESLAVSRALVATAVDGTPEVVVDGVTGRTVPPGAPVLLGEAICDLLGQPALLEKFGRQGRELVEREFNQDMQVRRTAELYIRSSRHRSESKVVSAVTAPQSSRWVEGNTTERSARK